MLPFAILLPRETNIKKHEVLDAFRHSKRLLLML